MVDRLQKHDNEGIQRAEQRNYKRYSYLESFAIGEDCSGQLPCPEGFIVSISYYNNSLMGQPDCYEPQRLNCI